MAQRAREPSNNCWKIRPMLPTPPTLTLRPCGNNETTRLRRGGSLPPDFSTVYAPLALTSGRLAVRGGETPTSASAPKPACRYNRKRATQWDCYITNSPKWRTSSGLETATRTLIRQHDPHYRLLHPLNHVYSLTLLAPLSIMRTYDKCRPHARHREKADQPTLRSSHRSSSTRSRRSCLQDASRAR